MAVSATNVLVTGKTIQGIINTTAQTISWQMINSRGKESLTFKKIWTGNFNCELAGRGIRPFKWNPKSYVVTFSGKFPEQARPIFMRRNTNLRKFTHTKPNQYFIRISFKSQSALSHIIKCYILTRKVPPFSNLITKTIYATEDSDIEQMQIPSTFHSLWSSTRFDFGLLLFLLLYQ